ncbi:hypothetical protein AAFC00_006299 [Neodothiora populina]|uniref:tRNA (adenine(58)-N(1))-methyltransferase catalytic subunit TRM61 n=1 Tax=Neodothiora populina TaxID=2781224 RepID=A0ABR3P4R0_9PEZI
MATDAPPFKPSPFFDAGIKPVPDSLALLHLRRDQLEPLTLHSSAEHADGYAEGAVKNTRFGSFPHSTLLESQWGRQVRASKVDTGSRGRKKRKLDEAVSEASDSQALKTAEQAGTGFVHLLPPTPETWTISLPHRTQVVYNPDYSYVLQRLQVRPGQTILEAGGGSGSFTHAAARAVFNGYPTQTQPRFGKVCTFEYHEPRAENLKKELEEHGLDSIVRVTHRDVYEDGFLIHQPDAPQQSPDANAVFLDLPAPWMALRNLTRHRLSSETARIVADSSSAAGQASPDAEKDTSDSTQPSANTEEQDTSRPFVSPLDPNSPIHLCTFSPCIEQVIATVAAMRRLGWTEIDMVEVMHKRIDVRRERVGLHEEGLRGVNATAATVDEAVGRLREVEGKFKEWHQVSKAKSQAVQNGTAEDAHLPHDNFSSKQARLDRIKKELGARKIFSEGRLVHRTEPDIKTHTSYLVFAVLPADWSEEQEQACRAKWPVHGKVTVDYDSGKKQKKKKNL